jgi:hypothetical protein
LLEIGDLLMKSACHGVDYGLRRLCGVIGFLILSP